MHCVDLMLGAYTTRFVMTRQSPTIADSLVGSLEWRTLATIVGRDSFFESDTITGRRLKTCLISSYLVMDCTETTRLSVSDR